MNELITSLSEAINTLFPVEDSMNTEKRKYFFAALNCLEVGYYPLSPISAIELAGEDWYEKEKIVVNGQILIPIHRLLQKITED